MGWQIKKPLLCADLRIGAFLAEEAAASEQALSL
jgi:hypothetical protein